MEPITETKASIGGDTTVLTVQVCDVLSHTNTVPRKTPILINEIGSVLNKCIEYNRKNEPAKFLVLPAKTGTGKSLTIKTYIAMLEAVASIVIVPSVEDAIEYCKDINEFSSDDNYARCYYSLAVKPDNSLRVEKEDLQKYRCIVITHSMFIRMLSNSKPDEFNTFYTNKRELVVIDERINLSQQYCVSYDEVEALIDLTKELQRVLDIDLSDELEWLMQFECHVGMNKQYCTDNKKSEIKLDALCSPSIEPWSFAGIQKAVKNYNIDICQMYKVPKSIKKKDSAETLTYKICEQLDAIELIFFTEHTLHKSGRDTLVMVHRKLDLLLGSAVVLDATANVNIHYKAMEILEPTNIEMIKPTNPRVYNNLTIYKMRGYNQSRTEIFKNQKKAQLKVKAIGYVKFVKSLLIKPTDKVLIVTFKYFVQYLEDEVKKTPNISITSYGNHVGKNKWSDHNKVVIIGWNYLSEHVNVSTYIGAIDDLTKSFSYDLLEIKHKYQITGIADDLVQASMRGKARTTIDIDGNCPESEVYLFYPDTLEGKAVVKIFEGEFNGAKVVEIDPAIVNVSPKVSSVNLNHIKVLDYLDEEFSKGVSIVKDTDIKLATGITKSTYSRLLINKEFMKLVEGKGYKHDDIVGSKGGAKGFYLK